jgi:electron-transferring-flavoprotein dehydrogenase
MTVKNETMEYDVVIVGTGPAGLAAAIKIKQLAAQEKRDIRVCMLEKSAQVGAHILSGAVLNPCSLKELLPCQWHEAPLDSLVSDDSFYWLSKRRAFKLPTPKLMSNHGNYVISLGKLCKFLGRIAEDLGCEIYPGFPASDILYDTKQRVIGVSTGAVGIDKASNKTTHYQPGMHLLAKQTLFAEGCRGQLSQRLMNRFNLRQGVQPQTYGLGIKEIWQVSSPLHYAGRVVHTIGWPLSNSVYGGSFIYHLTNNQVALGLVIGLDYKNPWLNPFSEMQRFKTHPFISQLLLNGERISYGARALNEGGWQAIPKLTFPGGALIGDSAGFLNVPQIKGIHTAMKSGMLAANACVETLTTNNHLPVELTRYTKWIKKSWVTKELYAVRNIRPAFRYGLWAGMFNAALETYITFGKSPWTLNHRADHKRLHLAEKSYQISYDKPDNLLTFDLSSSVALSNTFHNENQPSHLVLREPTLAIDVNYRNFASPESRYCPAGVYEIIMDNDKPRLQINAQNCLHCKTCDIKDPKQNIVWQAPEGGGGPNYIHM